MDRSLRKHSLVGLAALLLAASSLAWSGAVTWSPHTDWKGRQVNLGPTGARGWVHENEIHVVRVAPGSPADGALEIHDAVLGAGGARFEQGQDPRVALGRAITASETTRGGGKLILLVRRDGAEKTVQLRLRALGAYSPTWPFACPKSARILKDACAYLAAAQYPDGHVQGELGMATMWAGLLWLASGEAEYLDNARRAAYWLTGQSYSGVGLNSWPCGYAGLCVAEYYLATGDRTVLPWLEKTTKVMTDGQMRCGSWGHSSPWGGYGAVNQVGLVCFIAAILARECGVTVDEAAIRRSADFFRKYAGRGWVPYGDHVPWRGKSGNGKNALAAVAFQLLGGEADAVRHFSRSVAASHPYREEGHTGSYFSFFWGPLAAIHAGEKPFRTFLDPQRWYYDLARTYDGGLVNLPNRENLSGRTPGHYTWCGPEYTTAGMALVYALPLKKLRILGAERSVFGRKPPARSAHDKHLADQRKSVELTLRAFEDSIEEGDAYRASELLKSLERLMGKDNPQLANAQKLMAANERWVDEGRKYYQAWSRLRDYTWQYWHYYGRHGTRLLEGVRPTAPPRWAALVATSEKIPQTWRMLQWGDPKQEPPAKDPMWDKLDGWFKPSFSDASWAKIPAPLRNKRGKASGWNSRHVLLRKTFALPAAGYSALRLRLASGRGHAAEVYLNGVLVARIVRGVRRGYAAIPLDGEAARLLRQGENLIAVHCRKDDAGARSLDVGLQGVRRRSTPSD